jgi:FKBP-type peptidyl-prolyl cis-trans isomerase 2
MQTVQAGDCVQVHYVTSRGRTPVDLTIGTAHPRLPGLGLAMVGMAPGASITVSVLPENAHGPCDPTRVRRLTRKRFPVDSPLRVGKWMRVANGKGRRRLVRIMEVTDKTVLVDINHRWAGQAMELEVELLGINTGEAVTQSPRV